MIQRSVYLLLALFGNFAHAAPMLPHVWDRLGMQDGLTQDTVLEILQDSRGFVWLSTESGLNRYDGSKITPYYRGSVPGLLSDYVWAMAEGINGDVYFASNEGGLMQWHAQSDVFTAAQIQAPDDVDPAELLRTSALAIDTHGQIWLGTMTLGVLVFDAQGAFIKRYSTQSQRPLAGNSVTFLQPSKYGGMWIGTSNGLSFIGDTPDAAPPTLIAKALRHMNSEHIAAVLETTASDLWVATHAHGVTRFKADDVTHFDSTQENHQGLAHNEIRDLAEDSLGRVWVGTQAGISIHTPGELGFQTLRHDTADGYSLSNDYVVTLHRDRTGLMWVGTRGGGASRWNPRSLTLGPRLPKKLSGVHVNAFTTAANGEIWVGTIGAGLLRLDAEGNIVGEFSAAEGFPELPERRIMSLLTDQQGNVWIGTLSQGLLQYNPKQNRIEHYAADTNNPNALPAKGIMSLAELPSGAIAVGTFGGGVAFIDPQSKRVTRLLASESTDFLGTVRATALTVGVEDELWIGTENKGIIRYQTSTGTIMSLRQDASKAHTLPSNGVYAIEVTENGDVWAGTAGFGLALLTRAAIEKNVPLFQTWSSANGLAGNVIYGIEQDADGDLWLSSNKGLMHFDTKHRSIQSYRREHGLFSDEFNFGAHHRTPEGRLIFGGTSGFNVFLPQDVILSQEKPLIALTGFEKFNEPVNDGVAPHALTNIQLSHDDDVITFEFALLDFSAPEKNQYRVKLEGFDREWSPLSTRNRVTYTNLFSGRYTLRFKGLNSDGVWSKEMAIAVVVPPAPWATWWAYLAYLTMGLLLILAFLRWNVKSQQRKARMNHLVFYDQVTGLPNRELFEQRIAEAIRQGPKALAVTCIKVQFPKQVQETLGKSGKDEAMRALSGALLRISDTNSTTVINASLALIDKDEFALSIHGEPKDARTQRLLDKIEQLSQHPIDVGNLQVQPMLAIGVASFPRDSSESASLINHSVTAANHVSHSQKSGATMYDAAMTDEAASRLELESRLRDAILNDVLTMNFQPKFTNAGERTGAEALVRWNDKKLGHIGPDVFVSLAEESDLIWDLDVWVARAVCRKIQQWLQQGLKPGKIAINLSAANLASAKMAEVLHQSCKDFNVDPHHLEVELTESALALDVNQVRQTLADLKAHGFTIALDDFGTGYSSLTNLHDFAFDVVKIDRTFVDKMDESESKSTICKAIIALSKSLGIKTVAEGVETEAEQTLLVEMGCDELQGYLLSHPLPADQFEAMIRPAISG